MGMKLFDDSDDSDDDVEKISKIEINEEFAKRYEHNKTREDLQRLDELKKKGAIDDSGSESESSDEEDDDIDINSNRKDLRFFDALLKVRNKDPVLKEKDAKLFSSSDSSDGEEDGEDKMVEKKKDKRKAKYLKDVTAQHLLEEGPEFEEVEENVKTYVQEQEDLRKRFLEAMAKAEKEVEDDGDLLREKVKESEEETEDEGVNERLNEYFGPDEKLDENEKFLKEYFQKKMWIDKDKEKNLNDDDLRQLSEDEEEIEKQEDFEREFNFRFEEDAGDRVMGHSRFVEGSVRKKDSARERQRQRKEERMRQAEVERKEEVKRLKNLKKKEIAEKLNKIREIAGLGEDGAIPLTADDLEEEFDPEKYDEKMKEAFGDGYYDAEDADPGFGSDEEGGSGLEKPDFEKEDELLGLPKDWDVFGPGDGFLSEREKYLKSKLNNVGDQNEEEQGEDEEQPEIGKRKRKRKLSLKEKIAVEEDLEELYKLDYEGTIGDLKTRFKYRPVAPKRFGLKPAEMLLMDDKELNQYVSLKKIAPYRETEWKAPRIALVNLRKKISNSLPGEIEGNKKRKIDDHLTAAGKTGRREDSEVENGKPSNDSGATSRRAMRRRRQAELKLSQSRLMAYGKISSKPKKK